MAVKKQSRLKELLKNVALTYNNVLHIQIALTICHFLKPSDSPQQLIPMPSYVFGLRASGGLFMISAEPER
jgi:hypothetical protein